MSDRTPRLRMFAGPNGSGKTTAKSVIRPDWVGVYVNPDEIEAAVRRDGRLPLAPFRITAGDAEVRDYLTGSAFLRSVGRADACAAVTCRGDVVDFHGRPVDSYHASVLSDFVRRKLIAGRVSFSFETVMSAPDKVDLLRDARAAGFRTYLYYVATESPSINVERVRLRVSQGGHDVPEAKIVGRYHRSLALLRDAVRHTDRAFFFDTSGGASLFVAEVTDAVHLELKSNAMPNWFKVAVWDKF